MTDERLFTLDTDGDPEGDPAFYTGRVSDGRQVLLGYGYEGMLQVWFDEAGTLLGAEPLPVTREHNDGNLYMAQLLRRVREWKREVGYGPGRIRVRHFWLHEPFDIGIRLLPQWALDFLCDPYVFPTEEERQETQAQIESGLARGDFVLHWGMSQYYIGPDCLVST
jgi:hypothetical protein